MTRAANPHPYRRRGISQFTRWKRTAGGTRCLDCTFTASVDYMKCRNALGRAAKERAAVMRHWKEKHGRGVFVK